MENQHRQITGYRELDQADIDLMNEIKGKGAELDALLRKVRDRVSLQRRLAHNDDNPTVRSAEQQRLDAAEPERWASVGRTHFQEGLMALTRAVAQPGTF